MDQKELSNRGRKAAQTRWSNRPPAAAYQGVITLGDVELECAVLDDGQRVLSRRGIAKAFEQNPNGDFYKDDDQIPGFLANKSLKKFVPESIISVPMIAYRNVVTGGSVTYGYEASILPQICEVWLDARKAGVLDTPASLNTAEKAELIYRGLARTGVIALIDEATGYQYLRAKDDLAKILSTFIATELAQWVKTFPDDYYRELFRLRGWDIDKALKNRSPYIGIITNDIVYERLAPGVLEELKRKNPKTDKGYRESTHHQWLTRDIGNQKLHRHLDVLIAVMKLSGTYDVFIENLNKVAPKQVQSLFDEPFPTT